MKTFLQRMRQALGYGAGKHVVKSVSCAQDWAVLAQELAAQFAQVRHDYPDGQGWRVDIVSNRRQVKDEPQLNPSFQTLCHWLQHSGLHFAVHLSDEVPDSISHCIVFRSTR